MVPLLEVSDLLDASLRRLLDAERAAYLRGFNDGRAHSCVQLAEIEERRESIAWWRAWAAMLRRIIQNGADPSIRMGQVLAEIAADQKFIRDAQARLAAKPWTLSPLEWAVLRRVRLADPGDNASREAA